MHYTTEVSPAPKFLEISRIREFSENSTELCPILKIGLKRPRKLANANETLKKLSKIAQNFYIFVESTQKKVPKVS